jgi:hypothetical protein
VFHPCGFFSSHGWFRGNLKWLSESCDPEVAMRILLGIVVIVILVGSFVADYKWRQWMAARRRDRQ